MTTQLETPRFTTTRQMEVTEPCISRFSRTRLSELCERYGDTARVALHEAGHIVAHWVFGHSMKGWTIDDAEGGGVIWYAAATDLNVARKLGREAEHVRERLVIAAAGGEAVRLLGYLGADLGDSADREDMRRDARALVGIEARDYCSDFVIDVAVARASNLISLHAQRVLEVTLSLLEFHDAMAIVKSRISRASAERFDARADLHEMAACPTECTK